MEKNDQKMCNMTQARKKLKGKLEKRIEEENCFMSSNNFNRLQACDNSERYGREKKSNFGVRR